MTDVELPRVREECINLVSLVLKFFTTQIWRQDLGTAL